jgi:hypothetical protein
MLFGYFVIFLPILGEISCEIRNINPPPCDLANIYHGTWKYDRSVVIHHNPFHQCPNTMRKILQSYPKLKNQITAYTCQNKSYLHAEYIPSPSSLLSGSFSPSHSCTILPLHLSFKLLSSRKTKIYFIGDSLMGQLFIAFHCNMEQLLGPNHHIDSEFLPELFLRPDIPCESQCLTNSTFLDSENAKGLHQRCFGCPDGVYHPLNESFQYLSQFWPSKVLQDATHLVIGSGSWYAGYRQLLSPVEEYQRMLTTIKPILESLTRAHHLNIHWLDLPPMAYTPPPHEDIFGWNNFFLFNNLAKEIFENSSIKYLDTAQATRSRKARDVNLTDDFQHHWCNPGNNMIPTFLLRTYLHLLTTAPQ